MFYPLILISFLFFSQNLSAQQDTVVYRLTIDQKEVNIAGKTMMGMTVNDGIPGPTLRFTEGEYAVMYVTNTMDVETSVHWHGLLLPNFYDGVPYLTTPPILPGETQKYEFPLIQSGTYWYHSHTMLQEQSGVYGSIVIEPKKQKLDYTKELVIVLSDWTNQKPMNVLRNLKRGNEWYNIKKGTSTPLNRVIARGAFGAQLNFWKQRMESADIADIYYNAFLMNGAETQDYPNFKPGEKIRLRVINAAASSQFWLTFGGSDPLLIASDGIDVEPVVHNKTFIAIAETYDFIVEIPANGKVEFRATVQDGSGQTSAFLGKGNILPAPDVERPDKIAMMLKMATMKMRMGAPASKLNPDEENPEKMKANWGMQMKEKKGKHANMNHGKMKGMNHGKDQMEGMDMNAKKDTGMMAMGAMNMFDEYNYDYLKSPVKTEFDNDKPVKKILLNLTGNMWRYIWSINGVPLGEADKIQVKKGEVARITLNNLTMMHHPMHLHGHFFRVVNKNGSYSPLKHTVNVPPMQEITIEFDASESGDWFFHCHVLYHMMSGMARVFSYDTLRDARLEGFPLDKLTKEGNTYYNWAMVDVTTSMTEINVMSSNTRNQFGLVAEYGWNKNLEAEVTYERFVYDYFRFFVGVNAENEVKNNLEDITPTAIGGIRFLTPYLFNLDLRIDSKLRPEIQLSRSVMIFPRTVLFANYEFQSDYGWSGNSELAPNTSNYETTWSVGLEYLVSRTIAVTTNYDNRFGAGIGLSALF